MLHIILISVKSCYSFHDTKIQWYSAVKLTVRPAEIIYYVIRAQLPWALKLHAALCVFCDVQLDSLKKDLKPVHITLERDRPLLQDLSQTNSNNNVNDAASAASDRCTMLSNLSMNDEAAVVTRSPSPSTSRNVKRRSTVSKGFVASNFSFRLSRGFWFSVLSSPQVYYVHFCKQILNRLL